MASMATMPSISTRWGSRPYVTEAHGQWKITFVHAAWLSVAAAFVLSLIGVYMIDVALRSEPGTGTGGWIADKAVLQFVYLAVGILAGFTAALPHYRFFGRIAWPSLIVSVGLLIFLLVPFVPEWLVKPENGARCWINLRIAKLQPSELTKIAYVLVVAHYLRFRSSHRKFLGLFPIALISAVPLALIFAEPDLGMTMLFIPALFGMLLAAGARLRHLTLIVLVAMLAAPAAYPLLKPHQKVRIVGLLKQIKGDRDGAQDINYQSFTAQTLVGSGGWFGNGDAHTRALVRFNRLPERHNDMIFAVIGARFGLVGCVMVLMLYLAWIAGTLLTAANCKDPFGRLVCVGLAGFVAAQVLINVGMNIGILPIAGITLPFLSYGGSSMVTTWLTTGMILNIASRRPLPPFRQSFEYGDEDA